MFLSPEKSFGLPVYAEALAQASLISSPTRYSSSRFLGDRRVLRFFDISAIEEAAVVQCSRVVRDGGSREFSESSSPPGSLSQHSSSSASEDDMSS